MTRPVDPAKLNDAFEAYQSGKSVGECATLIGIGYGTMNRALHKAGLFENRQLRVTPPSVAEDFLAGDSVKELADRHGISRRAVDRMLRDAGVTPRDGTEAMRLRWARADAAGRSAMLDAAHAASRGRTASDAERIAIALAKAGHTGSAYECQIGAMLALRGVSLAFGAPCGRYNIDIVAGASVAVEVFGGNWHAHGRHAARFAERSRYVLDAEYDLLIIWVGKRTFDPAACAEHVVALTQLPDRNPAGRRQYRVIRGNGQLIADREDDGNEVPLIMPAGGSDGTGA